LQRFKEVSRLERLPGTFEGRDPLEVVTDFCEEDIKDRHYPLVATFAVDHNGARRWLDKHPVTAASPRERLANQRVAAHWAKRIEDLSPF
jgi:hypothetical protein